MEDRGVKFDFAYQKVLSDEYAVELKESEEKFYECLKKYTDKDRKLSKYQACKYLNMSRATFDKYIREGKIPKGKKEAGFKELFWNESDLREFCCRIHSLCQQ